VPENVVEQVILSAIAQHVQDSQVIRLSRFGPGQQQRTKQWLCCPSPHWGGEENGKKKTKFVVWDKDSLTEQQMKQTITINSGMYRATLTAQCPALSQ